MWPLDELASGALYYVNDRVDELLPPALLANRITADCDALGMGNRSVLPRWTDDFVYGAPRYEGDARVVSPWQAPFV